VSQIINQLKIFKRLFIHKKRYFLKNQSILRESCNQNKSLFFGIYLTCKFLITELQLIGPKNKTAKERNYYRKPSSDLKIANRFDEKYRFIFMDVFVDNLNTWNYFFTKNKLSNNVQSYLEIGCFEGMSSIFSLSKLENANCHFVDPFIPYDEMTNAAGINKFDEIFKNFKHNISFFGDRATLHRETSDVFFSKNTKNFDLVYIDGSHFGDDVYRDSVNAFKVLNKKGYIIFDDFFWIHFDTLQENPIGGIVKFLIENKSQIKIIYLSDQLFIQKK
jgi:hypothetical protein